MGLRTATPIEYFLWSEKPQTQDQLVYLDPTGAMKETQVPGGSLEEALRLFSTRSRSVRRSSGGMALAEPTQLVLYDPQQPGAAPQIRVRVRFTDLKFHGEHCTGETTVHTKIVAPAELAEPFPWNIDGSRRQVFGIEVGRGVVPVVVLCYQRDADGVWFALLSESADVEEALRQPRGSRTPVPVYRVQREVLRWLGSATTPSTVLERARRLYRRLRAEHGIVLPMALRRGEPVMVPGGLNSRDARQYLRIVLDRRERVGSSAKLQQAWENGLPMIPFSE